MGCTAKPSGPLLACQAAGDNTETGSRLPKAGRPPPAPGSGSRAHFKGSSWPEPRQHSAAPRASQRRRLQLRREKSRVLRPGPAPGGGEPRARSVSGTRGRLSAGPGGSLAAAASAGDPAAAVPAPRAPRGARAGEGAPVGGNGPAAFPRRARALSDRPVAAPARHPRRAAAPGPGPPKARAPRLAQGLRAASRRPGHERPVARKRPARRALEGPPGSLPCPARGSPLAAAGQGPVSPAAPLAAPLPSPARRGQRAVSGREHLRRGRGLWSGSHRPKPRGGSSLQLSPGLSRGCGAPRPHSRGRRSSGGTARMKTRWSPRLKQELPPREGQGAASAFSFPHPAVGCKQPWASN